jgi:hypothetical protein
MRDVVVGACQTHYKIASYDALFIWRDLWWCQEWKCCTFEAELSLRKCFIDYCIWSKCHVKCPDKVWVSLASKQRITWSSALLGMMSVEVVVANVCELVMMIFIRWYLQMTLRNVRGLSVNLRLWVGLWNWWRVFVRSLSYYFAIWLILPAVICLSQRLSHACPSSRPCTAKPRMAH